MAVASSGTPMRVRASDHPPCPAAVSRVRSGQAAAAAAAVVVADIGHENAREQRRRRDAVVIIIAGKRNFSVFQPIMLCGFTGRVRFPTSSSYLCVKPFSFVCCFRSIVFFFHTLVTFSFFFSF